MPAPRNRRSQVDPRLPPPGVDLSEDDFKTRVINTAHLHHWMVHHSRPARTARGWKTPIEGDGGLPDLVLARAGVVLLAELKSNTGRPTPEQRRWLTAAGPQGRLWAPRDWPEVLAELSQPMIVTPGRVG